jgi:hypothetical protein
MFEEAKRGDRKADEKKGVGKRYKNEKQKVKKEQ